MLTPSQCRMARAALRLTVRELAARSGMTPATISRFETETTRGYADTATKLRNALEAAGVEFLPETADAGPGVRLRKQA